MEESLEKKKINTTQGSMGALLRNAREKKKLAISKVAKDLYLRERQIEALEEERFSDLPQESFAKAFTLKYADYLDLEADEISKKFNAIYPDELRTKVTGDIESPIREMGKVYREDGRLFHFNPVLLAGSLAVFALAIFLMQIVTSAEEKQNEPKVVEKSIDSSEQIQGASLKSDGKVSTTGSAIGLSSNGNKEKTK